MTTKNEKNNMLKTYPNYFNKKVTISGGRILEFDSEGNIEVEPQLAEEILEKYPFMVFDPTKVTVEKNEKSEDAEYVKSVMERLHSDIYDLKERVKALKAEKKEIENDLQLWKQKTIELEKQLESANKAVEEEKIATLRTIENADFQMSLFKLSVQNLVKVCKDSGFPDNEWNSISKDKEKLIQYIVSKSE